MAKGCLPTVTSHIYRCELDLNPQPGGFYWFFTDFLSFHNLWSWNRKSTWKYEHLFSVWSLLLSGSSNLLPNHSQGSSTEWRNQNIMRVITAWVYYVPRGSLMSPFFYLIQWRWQHSLTWPTTHTIVNWEINPWKSFHLFMGSNLWPFAQNATCLTTRPPELTMRLLFFNYWR